MPRRVRRQPWYRLPFTEAVDFLMRKKVVTRPEFDEIFQWARNRAFTVTGVTRLSVLQKVLDGLVDNVRAGKTLADFEDKLDEIFSAAGIDPLDPWHAETVFRTNVQSAYGRGLYEQATDPAIRDEVWGWRYHTVGDDRVRDEHAELDGMTFRMGEADSYWPPWDFNCRCDAEIVLRSDAEEEGLESEVPSQEVRQALLESDFASPAVGDEYEPDLTVYHPTAVHDYLKEGPE